LSCIDHAVLRISDSHFLHVNIPHLQCDELMSTDSEYNSTDSEDFDSDLSDQILEEYQSQNSSSDD
jgi:hypothetical protein